MTPQEISEQHNTILDMCETLKPEAIKAIITKTKELIGDKNISTIDFREWGIESDESTNICLQSCDKHGYGGTGSPTSISIEKNNNGTEYFTIEISCEYSEEKIDSDDISVHEAVEILEMLCTLENDLNAEDAEWEMTEDGEIAYKD